MKSPKITFPANPNRIRSYFLMEKLPLSYVCITGILYNVGLLAGPWFEGQLAQTLFDIIKGKKTVSAMIFLALSYIAVILFVQAMRYAKRFYVRRFGNDVKRSMKQVLYRNLTGQSKEDLEREGTGSMMTKAVSDADTCAEGMRKFTTEIFDTGIALLAYLVMLFFYDWRLAFISCAFPPIALLCSEKLRKPVAHAAFACKESAGKLNEATLDRVSNAITYRTLGAENARDTTYEKQLDDYEAKAVRSGILESAAQPFYYLIAQLGVVFILWFGAKNVLGTGWEAWDIAMFTTFLSCFAKLALKTSKTGKLFNSVQKAHVSWMRIQSLLQPITAQTPLVQGQPFRLEVKNLSITSSAGNELLKAITFSAAPGQFIAITGPVACGKSTLGRAFLAEMPYQGSIRLGESELSSLPDQERCGLIAYQGHDAELISASIAENILLGEKTDVFSYLRAVCLDEEVAAMPDGINTRVGSGGIRLSGGQQARVALARTLCHKKPLMILDDPFAALDRATEAQIMQNLRALCADTIVLLFSHRLTFFPTADQVFWMENGQLNVSDHATLMRKNATYRALYDAQKEGEQA